ncbi:MAG: hypothetical protein J6J60_02015 [Clostridia bacterium]|nr:hypothetical protein [Clostridia bacterium]
MSRKTLSYCDKAGCGIKTAERYEELENYRKWFEKERELNDMLYGEEYE